MAHLGKPRLRRGSGTAPRVIKDLGALLVHFRGEPSAAVVVGDPAIADTADGVPRRVDGGAPDRNLDDVLTQELLLLHATALWIDQLPAARDLRRPVARDHYVGRRYLDGLPIGHPEAVCLRPPDDEELAVVVQRLAVELLQSAVGPDLGAVVPELEQLHTEDTDLDLDTGGHRERLAGQREVHLMGADHVPLAKDIEADGRRRDA